MAISSKASTSKNIGRALGYSDDDLTTPGHDALVLWVRDHWLDLVEEFFTEKFIVARTVASERLERDEAERFAREVENHAKYPNAKMPPRPVRAAPQLGHLFRWYRVEIEKRVRGGWIDVYGKGEALTEIRLVNGETTWGGPPWELAVEVKTNIRSFGELLRQLRVYREFLDRAGSGLSQYQAVCVVSPDARFAADIRQQGFLFHEHKVD